MKFDVITIFPEAFASYLNASILGRAVKKKKISVVLHDLRKYTTDKHQKVDDRPFGGGPGMVMKVEPFDRALKTIVSKRNKKTRVILLAAGGKPFTQKLCREYTKKYTRIVLLCGRYEGIDARVNDLVDEQVSVGPYVLTGGELPAMTVIDAVSRLLPGVLGTDASSADESFSDDKSTEYPQYTRPEIYKGKRVPKVLLSGHHKNIAVWRKKNRKKYRPF